MFQIRFPWIKTIRNSIYSGPLNTSLIDQGVVSGINFLVGIMIARFLGPEKLGLFSLVWSFVMVLRYFQTVLILSPMLSIGSKTKEDGEYFGSVIILQLLFGLLSVLLLVITFWVADRYFFEWNISNIAIPTVIAGTAFFIQDFIRRLHFARQNSLFALMIDTFGYGTQGLGIFFLLSILEKNSLAGVIYIIGATYLLSAILGFSGVRNVFFSSGRTLKTARRHTRFGLGLASFSLGHWMGPHVILLLSGVSLGPESLGGIRSAITLVAPVSVILLGLQNYLPVKAGQHFKINQANGVRTYLIKIAIPLLLVILFLLLILVSYRELAIELLFGIEFLFYSHLVNFQAVYIFLDAFMFLILIYLRVLEKMEIMLYWPIVFISISAAITWYLFPIAGEIATFGGLIANQILHLLLLIFMLKKQKQH